MYTFAAKMCCGCSKIRKLWCEDPLFYILAPLQTFFSSLPRKESEEKQTVNKVSQSFSALSLAGMATALRIPSPHRTGNVCPALGPHHAFSHCRHAARLWPQCHRDTG